jgi:arylformamidase
MSWIDISVPITHGMVHWPGSPPVVVERVTHLEHGDESNASQIALGVHTGTHVDAPIHFRPGTAGVDGIPIEALVGPARVIAIRDPVHVTVDELAAANVQGGERILLKTRNSPGVWLRSPEFVTDAVHLTTEAAAWLAARRVLTVGIDYLSVAGYAAGNAVPVHHTLIDAGVWIIEGLDPTHAPAGPCELVCLPIKLLGADGAPARAIIRPASARPSSGS